MDEVLVMMWVRLVTKPMGAFTGGGLCVSVCLCASSHPENNQGGHGDMAHPGNFSRGLKTS